MIKIRIIKKNKDNKSKIWTVILMKMKKQKKIKMKQMKKILIIK